MARVRGQSRACAQHQRTQMKLFFGDGRSAEDFLVRVLLLPPPQPGSCYYHSASSWTNPSLNLQPATPQHIISPRRTCPLRPVAVANASIAGRGIIMQPLKLRVRALGWDRSWARGKCAGRGPDGRGLDASGFGAGWEQGGEDTVYIWFHRPEGPHCCT
jgi:hypothetical protein